MIPHDLVEHYAKLAETTAFFGKRLPELTHRELLAAAAFAASETSRVREQSMRDAQTFRELLRAVP